MPRTKSNELRSCTACQKTGTGHDCLLLECLACLRDGNRGKEDQAFCNGSCFLAHWQSHRNSSSQDPSSGLATPRPASMEVKSGSQYSTPTLRASSTPFQPNSEKIVQHQQQQRKRATPSRVLQFPAAMPNNGIPYPHYGPHNPQAILATGSYYQRR